ncbi:uncharacterized protein LOC143869875 [Tasmannia lanceolata]|uniref:uncharacterized protein LOC143869875 n=1 Tax=Tasmannia lanceolata TaxID=3420 RepID=UPI004062C128
MAAKKLRLYFQAHTINVLTDQPLRQILHKPNTSGRLGKWAVELSEFDILYLLRPTIKAQVLADFVAECTMPMQNATSGTETVQPPGGELTTLGRQVRTEEVHPVDLETTIAPEEQNPSHEQPLWELNVDGSSNKLGSGASLILTGPENFVVDYTLVVNEVQGTYEARDERMIKYLAKVYQLVDKFKSIEVVRIPRTENAKADVLSKLAASGYTALKNICMEFLKKSNIECEVVEVMQVDNEP